MSLTINSPATATDTVATGTASPTLGAAGDKGFLDFLGGLLPGAASTGAPVLGIDPRVAGQTVASVLGLFGIGGPGKAFTAAIPRDQAMAQLKEIVGPHLGDPAFDKALNLWLQTALQPVQAHRQGKAYQPDLDKGWFDDAWDAVSGTVGDIGDALSGVDWGQVGKIGMQALPVVLAML